MQQGKGGASLPVKQLAYICELDAARLGQPDEREEPGSDRDEAVEPECACRAKHCSAIVCQRACVCVACWTSDEERETYTG